MSIVGRVPLAESPDEQTSEIKRIVVSSIVGTAQLAQSWEISVSEEMRGGAERTRTPCQAGSSIEPVSVTAPMLQARAQSSPLGGEPEPAPLPLYRPP
jgi:hypothetical protein